MKAAIGVAAAGLLTVFAWTGTYTLDETEQAVITRFG